MFCVRSNTKIDDQIIQGRLARQPGSNLSIALEDLELSIMRAQWRRLNEQRGMLHMRLGAGV